MGLFRKEEGWVFRRRGWERDLRGEGEREFGLSLFGEGEG